MALRQEQQVFRRREQLGRQGRTARALRLCLGAAAARMGRRADLEIAD